MLKQIPFVGAPVLYVHNQDVGTGSIEMIAECGETDHLVKEYHPA
jgi:hypothetical protein